MSTINAGDSRVNVLLRLLGIMFFALGAAMIILTNQAAAAASIQPQVVPVDYLVSSMLMIAGLMALVTKYKGSGAPKA
jgi:hypothetical protein